MSLGKGAREGKGHSTTAKFSFVPVQVFRISRNSWDGEPGEVGSWRKAYGKDGETKSQGEGRKRNGKRTRLRNRKKRTRKQREGEKEGVPRQRTVRGDIKNTVS